MADTTPSPSPHTNRKKSRRSKRDGESRMVGNWEIGKTIGRGSSGRVKIAQHIETKQHAAIKIVSKQALITSRMSITHAGEQQEKIMLGIEREIVLMKLIDHPNVLSLYDVYETSNDLYLIIEYVEGGELFEYLVSRGRLPVSETLHYFQQIISAMDYCHSFNIAHRDLKPENLLLDRHKNIKVADFGMAAWEGGTGMLETSCGSPHYASPEVVQGKAYRGCTSDIWSCGVILFALLAGRLPFDDGNIRTLLEKVKIGKYTIPSDIPLAAKHLIRRMLEKDVDQRITMKEILTHPFFTSCTPRPLPGGGIPPAPPSLREVTRPVGSVDKIDPDIFGNLKTLWHGAPEEEIITGLMNNEKTWEKAVYHLLLKYRAHRLEDYDEERDAINIKEEIAEKRMLPPPPVVPIVPIVSGEPVSPRKQQSLPDDIKCTPGLEPVVIKNTAPSSESTASPLRLNQPAGPRPPPITVSTPTAKNRTSLDHPIIQVQTATPEKRTTIIDRPPPVPTKNIPPPLNLASRSPLPSPIISFTPVTESPALPPIEVPDLGDPNMQRFFRQIVEHLSVMQPRSSIAASDGGRSGVSSMGSGSERMSAQHSHGGTSGYSSQMEGDGDTSRFADADEEFYATDMEGYASSTGGGSIRSAGTSAAPKNLARTGAGSNRHSYHQPPVPPPKDETIRGGTVFGRLQSSRPPPLRGSSYGSSYHQNLHTHPLQSRALSNRQSAHSPPLSAPPIPGRHRSYPVQSVYASEKENSIPPRATLSAGVAPRPSLKNTHSGGAGTIERQKSNGKKHVQIILPGEEARLKRKKSFSTIGSSDDPSFFVAPMEKRSWFGSLFKFKPASYHLLSVYDFSASRDECRRLLMGLGVQVTVENTGYLSCRFDEFRDPSGVMGSTKAVRFRVEMQAVGHAHTIAGFTTSVTMIQEKGALSTFKLLYNRLRRDWDFDAPPPPILLKAPSYPGTSLPSPTLSTSPTGRSPITPEIY